MIAVVAVPRLPGSRRRRRASAAAAVGAAGRSACASAIPRRADRRGRRDRRSDPRAVFATDNPRVATVDRERVRRAGRRRPGDDHRRRSTARWPGRSISVEDHDRDEPWSFRNHVEPVLTKQGCNVGCVPRRGGGQERVSPDLARLCARDRPRGVDPPGPGPPRRQDGPAGEPDPAQADRRDRARRRGPVHDRLARIPRDRRVDRRRHAGAHPRPTRRSARSTLYPGRRPARARAGVSRCWSRRPTPTAASRT